MPKFAVADLGPNSFSISYSAGHTDKQFIDIFREQLTMTVEGVPKYGWEVYDYNFDASGKFVARALNDDDTYKYAIFRVAAGRLVLELAENWDVNTHTTTKWCGYRVVPISWYSSESEAGLLGMAYYPDLDHNDRQVLICSAHKTWLFYDVDPYSKLGCFKPTYLTADTLRKSATGIVEVFYGKASSKAKAYLTNLLGLTGMLSGNVTRKSWGSILYFGKMYPCLIYPISDTTPIGTFDYRGESKNSVVSTIFGPILGRSVGELDNQTGYLKYAADFTARKIFNGTTNTVAMHMAPLDDAVTYTYDPQTNTNMIETSSPYYPSSPEGNLYGLKISNAATPNYDIVSLKCTDKYMLDSEGEEVRHLTWQARIDGSQFNFLLPL